MLLNRPNILLGESLASYLHRLANFNHYPSVSYIAQLLGLTEIRVNNNNIEESDISSITNLSGQSWGDLALAAGIITLKNISPQYLDRIVMRRRVKYCSSCIKSELVHKLEWIFYPLDTCIEHREKLIEFCPKCNEIILLKNLILGECSKCGFNYQDADSCKIDKKSVLYLSQYEFKQRFINGSSISSFPGLTHQSYLILAHRSFYLLEGLDSFVDNQNTKIHYFHNKLKAKQTSELLGHAWANFYWMYLDFPKNFYLVLGKFHLNKKGPIKYFLLNRFEELFLDDVFCFVRDAYHEFWTYKIDEGSIRKDFSVFKNNPELLEKRKFIRKDEIRNMTGMSYEYLQKLHFEQKIDIQIKERRSAYGYLIEKEKLNGVLIEKGKLISKKEVTLILGINSGSIQKLINADILNTYKLTTTSIEKLNHDEVNMLMDHCRGSFIDEIDSNYIKFHNALIKYSVCHLTIDKIVEYTLKGELNPVNPAIKGSLADNYYEVNELIKCIQDIKEEYRDIEGYYMSDVMKILRIGEKKMRRYIQEGKIVHQQIVTYSDGRKRYLFNKKEIDKLVI
jgi:hypothetical protein